MKKLSEELTAVHKGEQLPLRAEYVLKQVKELEEKNEMLNRAAAGIAPWLSSSLAEGNHSKPYVNACQSIFNVHDLYEKNMQDDYNEIDFRTGLFKPSPEVRELSKALTKLIQTIVFNNYTTNESEYVKIYNLALKYKDSASPAFPPMKSFTNQLMFIPPPAAAPAPPAAAPAPPAVGGVHFIPPAPSNDYATLKSVLDRAFDQASKGKGKERHAQNLPFDKQPMLTISDMVGSADGLRYQAIKKIQESKRLPVIGHQVAELLGAINYLAGVVIFTEKKK